jgi:hypothetical protein
MLTPIAEFGSLRTDAFRTHSAVGRLQLCTIPASSLFDSCLHRPNHAAFNAHAQAASREPRKLCFLAVTAALKLIVFVQCRLTIRIKCKLKRVRWWIGIIVISAAAHTDIFSEKTFTVLQRSVETGRKWKWKWELGGRKDRD